MKTLICPVNLGMLVMFAALCRSKSFITKTECRTAGLQLEISNKCITVCYLFPVCMRPSSPEEQDKARANWREPAVSSPTKTSRRFTRGATCYRSAWQASSGTHKHNAIIFHLWFMCGLSLVLQLTVMVSAPKLLQWQCWITALFSAACCFLSANGSGSLLCGREKLPVSLSKRSPQQSLPKVRKPYALHVCHWIYL